MLQSFADGAPGCVWIGMSGLRALWEKTQSNGQIAVIQRPTNQTYALELKIADPDCNILWFGTEPLRNVPFGQEPAEGNPLES